MPVKSILGLDLPSIAEIKAEKALRFPQAANGGVQIMYSTMASLQDAIDRALSPGSAPTADPAQSSLVMAGVRWLGNTLFEAEIEVKRPIEDGEDEVIEDHPLTLMLRRPNPFMSGSTMWKAFAYSWLINGNAHLLKFRNFFGQVVQVWYEPHWSIRPRWVNDKQGVYIPGSDSQSVPAVPRNDANNQFINYYELDRDGFKFRIEPEDVVHFRDGIDPYNTRLGLSGIATILREIFADSAIAAQVGQLMGSHGIPPFVLNVDKSMNPQFGVEDLQNVKAMIKNQMGTGEPLVVTNATVEQTGMSLADMDQRVSRYLSEERFSAVTGIPAVVLNFGSGMERSIYNNVKQADLQATQRYLVPLWWYIDEELTRQILPDFDQDESHFVEHCTDEVAALQEDQDALWTRNTAALKAGGITRKQFLQNLGLPFDDARDDVYVGPSSSPIQDVEETQQPQQLPSSFTGQPKPGQVVAMRGLRHLVDPAQQEQARESWERHAPKRLKGLITAKAK